MTPRMPPASDLTVSDLTVTYGQIKALDHTHLRIPKHQITALVGPSGCGKSTLLHTLNRLTDLIPGCHVSGCCRTADGANIHDANTDVLALRRRIGMVFQKPNPFPHSIRQNFEIPLRAHGVPRAQLPEIIKHSLQAVGLWREVSHRLDLSALQLSGGQQQRLCIARALALQPEVVLFDEPCSALDPIASAVVEEQILALREPVTIVIVTHNLAQARRMADHLGVFWIKNGAGTIVEEGSAKEVFASATDPDARAYLAGVRG